MHVCVCVCLSVGGCYSSHHLDNYGSFYRWALKGESVIINVSHWHLGKACYTYTHVCMHKHTNTQTHTKTNPHAGDLNYLNPLIAGPHTQTP